MKNSKNIVKIITIVLVLAGVIARFHHIDFGLPHSFYADEPEFSEVAIKYTYEIKDIIKNNNYYKLIPISYVYGTFPSYFLTITLMIFSKTLNIVHITFDKTTLFIFLRVVVNSISLCIIPLTGLLVYNLSKNKYYGFLAVTLAAINWKFIVHAHYVNADIILTTVNLLSIFLFVKYLDSHTYKSPTRKHKVIFIMSAIFYGIAAGTKITALITAPLLAYIFIRRKDLYGLTMYFLIALGTFMVTNPFSLIFFNDFTFRIFEMLTKEGGVVFDSVDYSLYKYVLALNDMLTSPIFITALLGIGLTAKNLKKASGSNIEKNILLIGSILLYFIFYTIQSRRVDRWLLPILPLMLVYVPGTVNYLLNFIYRKIANNKNKEVLKTIAGFTLFLILITPSLYYIGILSKQFQSDTPKSAAYKWVKTNLPEMSTKLVYTEEGLDPMNKVNFAHVIKFNVYTSENAQLEQPENPYLYDYVILSSRPMANFQKPYVKEHYPYYANQWQTFLNTVQDPNKFELIKDFTLTKPNLIPLSDVFVYQRSKTEVYSSYR